MVNLLAGLIGAVIGLGGVAVGAWLQGLKEHLLGARSRNRDRPGDRGDGPEFVTDQL
jgi:hypothetical protein